MQKEIRSAEVLRVIDGDTLEVADQTHGEVLILRLWGIDAPEMEQPGGEAAAAQLRSIVNRYTDGLFSLQVFAFDSYARAIGLLYSRQDGCLRSVNIRMLAAGYAHCSRYQQGHYYRELLGFYEAERRAKTKPSGLWGADTPPVLPWIYRQQQGNQSQGLRESGRGRYSAVPKDSLLGILGKTIAEVGLYLLTHRRRR